MQLFTVVLRTINDGDIEQQGLFSNIPECDAPSQSAGVAGSTVIKQHLRISLGMIRYKFRYLLCSEV
jgi:hypothetical protein